MSDILEITFKGNPKTKRFILSIFGKDIDSEGFIVEKLSGKRVLGSDGQEITLEDLGVIKNGSEIYSKENIVSLVDFYKKYLSG